MTKEVIDLTASPPSCPPKSSKTQKAPKLKTSTSSKKTQFKNKKCARCSKPQMPNLNYCPKDHFGQTYGFCKAPQAQSPAAVCESHVAKPKISLLQQGLDLLEPLIPIKHEPLQLEHYAWNKPPQVEQNYPIDFFNNVSATCLYCSAKNNSTSASTSHYSNTMMMKISGPRQSFKFFPDADVNNNTSAFKGLEKKRVDAGAITRASRGEVDLELRLCSTFKLDN